MGLKRALARLVLNHRCRGHGVRREPERKTELFEKLIECVVAFVVEPFDVTFHGVEGR